MSYTILLADDSATTHRVVELTFAGEPVHVESVTDGQQALESLRTLRPDLVMAEVALPRVDGYQLCRHVRSLPAFSDVPVLLLTGAFDVVDEARVRASGAAGIIIKPFEPELVINRVKELLGFAAKDAPAASGRLVTPDQPPAHHRVAPEPAGGPETAAAAQSPAPDAVDTGTTEPAAGAPATAQSGPAASDAERQAAAIDAARRPDAQGEAGFAAEINQASVGPSTMYFDQLDEAFNRLDQQLAGAHSYPSESHSASGAAEGAFRTAASPVLSDRPVFEIDEEWFGGNLGPPANASKRLTHPVIPDVADTFQALLAAEQGELPVAPASESLVISDEVVDRIATRVAERLSEGVFVDTVTRVVETVAERLVREEIARIRARAEALKGYTGQ